jgi:hypothetical protein
MMGKISLVLIDYLKLRVQGRLKAKARRAEEAVAASVPAPKPPVARNTIKPPPKNSKNHV